MSGSCKSVFVATLIAGSLAAPGFAQVVEIGDQPSYQFRSEVFQARGWNSLEDLRGKPVFVENWGTR